MGGNRPSTYSFLRTGTVYRDRDTVLDWVVTLKVINQSIEDYPAHFGALQREA